MFKVLLHTRLWTAASSRKKTVLFEGSGGFTQAITQPDTYLLISGQETKKD